MSEYFQIEWQANGSMPFTIYNHCLSLAFRNILLYQKQALLRWWQLFTFIWQCSLLSLTSGFTFLKMHVLYNFYKVSNHVFVQPHKYKELCHWCIFFLQSINQVQFHEFLMSRVNLAYSAPQGLWDGRIIWKGFSMTKWKFSVFTSLQRIKLSRYRFFVTLIDRYIIKIFERQSSSLRIPVLVLHKGRSS